MQKFSSILEKIVFGLVIFLLAFIPLYPKFPLFNVKGTFVAVRLEDFIIALTFVLWGIVLLLKGSLKTLITDKLNKTLILFFFIGALSLFSGIFLTQTVKPQLGLLHYLRRIEIMMLLPLVFFVIKDKKQVVISLIVLSVVTLIVNVYGIGQQYLNFPIISTTTSELSKGQVYYMNQWARINSTFAGHYDLAVFLMMVIILNTALIFFVKGIFFKTWLLVIGVISSFALIMTAARLSFLAVLVGIAAALILVGKRKFILLMIALSFLVAIYPSNLRNRIISTITVNFQNSGERYSGEFEEQLQRNKLNIPTLPGERGIASLSAESTRSATVAARVAADLVPGEPTDTTQLGVYRSFAIRFDQEWPRAWRAFLKNPLLGTGYSSIGLATDNDFLRSLGEMGIFGTIAFGLIFIEILKRIWKNYNSQDKFLKHFSAGVLALILAFAVNALFIDVFEASKIAALFWMIIGLNLAAGKALK